MNQQAAKELMQCMMPDDFVQRREMLNAWSAKWITTMHVEFTHDGTCPKEQEPEMYLHARKTLLREILNGLVVDEKSVLLWGKLVGNPNSLACEMHVIKQTP